MKKPQKKNNAINEERYRSSHLVFRLTSFGTDPQHQKTIQSVLSELELRGYDVALERVLPVAP